MGQTTKRTTVTIDVETTARADTVEKQVKEAFANLLEEWRKVSETTTYALVGVRAEKYPPEPLSKAARLSKAAEMIADGVSLAEEVKEELESWRDNLPENFQDKADELDQAIDEIGGIISEIDASGLEEVEVPGAFGR